MLKRLFLGSPSNDRIDRPTTGTHGVTSDDPSIVVVDTVARYLETQRWIYDAFDARAFAAFSVGSTVLPVTFGLLRLGSGDIGAITQALLIVALAAYLAVLFCSWRASRIRSVIIGPQLSTLEANSLMSTSEELRRWVAREYAVAANITDQVLVRKGRRAGRATAFLYAEGVSLSIAAISTLF